MTNINIYKKPELAVLSDEKKIRTYNDVERLTIAKNIVENLLNSLGVGSNSNEQHHIEAIKYIASDKTFSPSEFSKAFELALNGSLNIELFQQINCLVIGKVMNLYKKHKFEKLKVYKQKILLQEHCENELSDSAKNQLFFKVLKEEFESFKASASVNEMRNWLYDELIKFDISVNESNKTVLWKHSITEIKSIQRQLQKRERYDDETLRAKAIVIYKKKLIESIFGRFQSYTQLLNKLK